MLLSPLRSPLQPALRGPLQARVGGQFLPQSVMTAWWDASVLSSVWQNTAGTLPATVDSQVARIDDLSGGGFHLLQADSARRPFLRQSGGLYWLELDGVDDRMECAISTISAYPLHLVAGAEISASASYGALLCVYNSATAALDFTSLMSLGNLGWWQNHRRGGTNNTNTENFTGSNNVAQVIYSIANTSSVNVTANGRDDVAAGANALSFGSLNTIRLGCDTNAATPWLGKFFCGGYRAGALTQQTRKLLEKAVMSKCGSTYATGYGLISEGDSITAGSVATSNIGYAQQLETTVPRAPKRFAQAVSGNFMADISGRLSTTQTNINAMIAAGLVPVVTLLTGANDRPGTTDAAQTLFDAVSSYAATVRGYGAKFVMCTAIASDPATYAAYESTGRPHFNSLLRANSSQFDALCDFAADSRLNVYSVTNYGDVLHPNNTGHAAMRDLLMATLSTVRV